MKTLPDKFWIKIHSKEHAQLVIDKVKSFGVTMVSDFLYKAIDSYSIESLAFSVSRKRLEYSPQNFYEKNSLGYGEKISTDELLQFEVTKETSVILNNEYTAIISKSGIKVGCQTFSLEIIDKLLDAKKQLG